jgi:hypothetical protein
VGGIMENPLVKNAYQLLIAMVEDAGNDHNKLYPGNKLSQMTSLSPDELNDAVSLLSSGNLLTVFGALGTAPYKFHMVGPNAAGRYKYHELKTRKEHPETLTQPKEKLKLILKRISLLKIRLGEIIKNLKRDRINPGSWSVEDDSDLKEHVRVNIEYLIDNYDSLNEKLRDELDSCLTDLNSYNLVELSKLYHLLDLLEGILNKDLASAYTEIDPDLIFISYSSEDKRLAARVKELLEENSMHGFLAHEDIVSDRWLPIIEENLGRCSCLIAVVTENFDKRWWTNQEVGYVLGAGKKIFPIFLKRASRDSMGFISEYQGEAGVTDDNFDDKIQSLITKIKSEIKGD